MDDVIRFGTSGFRGIIASDFNFKTLDAAVRAIADYARSHPLNTPPRLIVGYDPRFMGEVFAKRSAELLAANGIDVLLTMRDTPTPVLSYYVIKHGLDGAVNITASHNPPAYTGIKFTPSFSGTCPAMERPPLSSPPNTIFSSVNSLPMYLKPTGVS